MQITTEKHSKHLVGVGAATPKEDWMSKEHGGKIRLSANTGGEGFMVLPRFVQDAPFFYHGWLDWIYIKNMVLRHTQKDGDRLVQLTDYDGKLYELEVQLKAEIRGFRWRRENGWTVSRQHHPDKPEDFETSFKDLLSIAIARLGIHDDSLPPLKTFVLTSAEFLNWGFMCLSLGSAALVIILGLVAWVAIRRADKV